MKNLLLILIMLLNPPVQQQFKLVRTIPGNWNFFSVDRLGYIYLARNDELFKYHLNGKEMARYSNKALGRISLIDVSNPLKILLYYEDLSQILFLDNTLSLQGEQVALEQLNFDEFRLDQSSLVCTSHNNGIWLYDPLTFQLIRLNENLEISQTTGNLIQLLGTDIQPVHLLERNNWVYLNNPEQGILVFDIYGTYIKTIPLKGLQDFQIHGNKLFYQKDNMLQTLGLRILDENEIALPEKNDQVRVLDKTVYLLSHGELKIYTHGQ